MKKTIIITCFVVLTYQRVSSQDNFQIDFESSTGLIEIDTTNPNNIWQIGQSNKDCFNSTISGKNSIVTDTTSFYPNNSNSSFTVKIPSKYLDVAETVISFWHKFDTEAEKDSGYIEYSFDGGLNWNCLVDTFLEDTRFGYWSHWDSSKTHGLNGDLKITGDSKGWINSEYKWVWFIPCKIIESDEYSDSNLKSTNESPFPDSLYVRFVFISDSINENKCGWIIDNIEVYEIFVGDVLIIDLDQSVSVYPNPTDNILKVKLPENLKLEEFIILNSFGQKLKIGKVTDSLIEIDVSNLPNGQYFIQFYDEGKTKICKRIIII